MHGDFAPRTASILLALSVVLVLALASPSRAAGVGFWITGIEAVQAVQTPSSGVPLIGGKPTFVRVYVRSNERNHGPWTNISSTLTVKTSSLNRTHKPISSNRNGTITVSPSGSHRDQWTDSFTFALDPDECAPNQQMFVVARIYSTTGESDGSSPGDHQKAAALNFSPAINLSVYAFAWQAANQDDREPDGTPNTRTLNAIKWVDYAVHEQYLRAVFPVSHFAFVPVPSIGTDTLVSGNERTIRTLADKLVAAMPAGSVIHFLKAWDTGGGHGYASGQRSDAENGFTQFRAGTVSAQEISHTLGLWCHTFDQPCTSPPYQPYSYPRPDGRVDVVDVGIYNRYPPRLISGSAGVRVAQQFSAAAQALEWPGSESLWRDDNSVVSDFMSYNGSPTLWISSFTYCQLLKAVTDRQKIAPTANWSGKCVPAVGDRFQGGPIVTATPVVAGKNHLYVSGTINRDGNGELTELDQIVPSSSQEIRPGPYRIALLAEQGRVLRQVAFGGSTTHPHQRAPSVEHFGLLVPFEDIAESTARVELRYGDRVLAARTIPPHAPTVSLEPFIGGGDVARGVHTLRWTASDSANHLLTYTVEYSRDGGEHWSPLGVDPRGTSLKVDFDRIAGSDRALIRVRASNGGRVAYSQTERPFRVQPKEPVVVIHAPLPGLVVAPGVPAIGSGSAVTLENGAVTTDRAYRWSSDKDGPLKEGRWIVLNGLSAGDHELTLTVQGANELKSSASVKIKVLPDS
jgi:hypothetical protein